MNPVGSDAAMRRCACLLVLVLALPVLPVWADLDPNASSTYPNPGGYGIVICGNSHVEYGLIDEMIKQLLCETYLAMVENLGIDPNNAWVLVDQGNNVDNWTQGLFDDLPATKAMVASTFQTIGQRMWDNPSTPRNLVVAIGGHGGRYSWYPTYTMRVQLADQMVYDDDFIDDCVNELNNNVHGVCPIERLDMIMTMCYSGALLDDFRGNFHNLRGSTWPGAKHFSAVTAGDCLDVTTGFFGVQLVLPVRNDGEDVNDLNGDGTLSIYEYYDHAAKADLTNPTVPYAPDMDDVIYIPSDFYYDLGYAEHPLYYEWNAPLTIELEIVNFLWGNVDLDPAPEDANNPRYASGTTVTLTAQPNIDREFSHWLVYDPNHPDDANYAVTDTNYVLILEMDADQRVVATFACGHDIGQILPPLLVTGVLVAGLISRRPRH